MAGIKLMVVLALASLCGSTIATEELPKDPAKLARYVIHNSDWLSLATISTHKNITGFPFVTIKSTSDGPETNSTGIPYLYMTDLDISSIDLKADPRVTIMVSLAQSDYCRKNHLDQQNPSCARVFIAGKFAKVDKTSTEYTFAKNAMFEKHPEMKFWPENHGFFVAKVIPEHIFLLAHNHYGGIKNVSPADYLQAEVPSSI